MYDWICLKIYDKCGKRLNLNDQVEFIVNKNKHSGFIQGIYNGYIKINSLAGEFRRKPHNVVKL